MKLGPKILELRLQGLTYRQIMKELNCSSATVSYHCGEGQKEKSFKRNNKLRIELHPYYRKIETFCSKLKKQTEKISKLDDIKLFKQKINNFLIREEKMSNIKKTFTVDDVIKKFGEKPKCYLTGDEIDISKPRTYQFDHIIPVSKGGKNTIDNLGICTKEANMTKSDSTIEELMILCTKILKQNGYKIEKD